MRGHVGRASLVRGESHTLALRVLADGRLLVHPVPLRSVVAGAHPPRERQDRLPCQGCGEPFPVMDMWIDGADPRRGFCDRCYYARPRPERSAEAG